MSERAAAAKAQLGPEPILASNPRLGEGGSRGEEAKEACLADLKSAQVGGAFNGFENQPSHNPNPRPPSKACIADDNCHAILVHQHLSLNMPPTEAQGEQQGGAMHAAVMGHTVQVQAGESGILNEGVAQLLGTLNTNAIH